MSRAKPKSKPKDTSIHPFFPRGLRKAIKQRDVSGVIKKLEAYCEEHPANAVARGHLDRLLKGETARKGLRKAKEALSRRIHDRDKTIEGLETGNSRGLAPWRLAFKTPGSMKA